MPWMRRLLKTIFLILYNLSWVLFGLFTILFLWLFFSEQKRDKIKCYFFHLWAKGILHILDFQVEVEGAPEQGSFWVSNHWSYLDISILGSIQPLLFISKSDVKTWPIFGWLAIMAGSIFLNRNENRDLSRVIKPLKQKLINHMSIVCFPEGTSTDGKDVLPFKPSLFLAPIEAERPVQPVLIEYVDKNGFDIAENQRNTIAWYGSAVFVTHLWKLLSLKKGYAKVIFANSIKIEKNSKENLSAARKKIAHKSWKMILKLKTDLK